MPEAYTSPRSADARRPAANRSGSTPDARASLQALFAEVAALANQLRKTPAFSPRQDDSPSAGWGILQILDRLGPQTVPAIARIRSLSRQNIQTLVNRLESQGSVALAPNPAHKRSALVQLTESGRSLVAAVTKREALSLQGLLPYLSPARLVPAARLLRQLRALLAGSELPPAESAEERLASKQAKGLRRPARHRKTAPLTAPPPPPLPEPAEPEESEFPINLL